MSKKTLSSIVKATGLAAILAGTAGCGIAGNTIAMHQKSPYTAGFIGGMGSLADSQREAARNGKRYNVADFKLPSGALYTGEVLEVRIGGSLAEVKPDGKGIAKLENCVYEGEFLNGRWEGYGVYDEGNGKIWEGYWSKGKWAGKTREEYDIKKGISSKD